MTPFTVVYAKACSLATAWYSSDVMEVRFSLPKRRRLHAVDSDEGEGEDAGKGHGAVGVRVR